MAQLDSSRYKGSRQLSVDLVDLYNLPRIVMSYFELALIILFCKLVSVLWTRRSFITTKCEPPIKKLYCRLQHSLRCFWAHAVAAKNIKSWKRFVSKELRSNDWEVMHDESDNDEYRSQITFRYGLDPTPQTPFLFQHSTDTLVCLCTTGVYGFGIDFDSGFLVSGDIKSAIQYIEVPGTPQEGPTRRGDGSYDPTGDDIFKTTDDEYITDDNDTPCLDYDSGFEE